MYKAVDIANYFIYLWEKDNIPTEGPKLDLLKLQCSMFYAQAHHLLMYGKELFKEVIVAHKHGPCILEIGCPDDIEE